MTSDRDNRQDESSDKGISGQGNEHEVKFEEARKEERGGSYPGSGSGDRRADEDSVPSGGSGGGHSKQSDF